MIFICYIACFLYSIPAMTAEHQFIRACYDVSSIVPNQLEQTPSTQPIPPQGRLLLRLVDIDTFNPYLPSDYTTTAQYAQFSFQSTKGQITLNCSFNIAHAAINDQYLVILANDSKKQMSREKHTTTPITKQYLLVYKHTNFSPRFDLLSRYDCDPIEFNELLIAGLNDSEITINLNRFTRKETEVNSEFKVAITFVTLLLAPQETSFSNYQFSLIPTMKFDYSKITSIAPFADSLKPKKKIEPIKPKQKMEPKLKKSFFVNIKRVLFNHWKLIIGCFTVLFFIIPYCDPDFRHEAVSDGKFNIFSYFAKKR